MADEYYDEQEEPIEGYCMRCRQSVDIVDPAAVWTRRGMPAVRGECAICAGVVFRMGKTHLHQDSQRPQAVTLGDDTGPSPRQKLQRQTVYINFSADDETLARTIAGDLEKSGVPVWLHDDAGEETAWVSGVHPALKDCARMVLVICEGKSDASTAVAWAYFRQERKPVVLALCGQSQPPDALRRSPRFDFQADYKGALRSMINALG